MGIIPPGRGLPSQAYKTYQIIAPVPTHWRPATCEEVECVAWRNGWKTIVPSDSAQAQYIRSGASGRRFVESTGSRQLNEALVGLLNEALVEFMFEPGQRCFAAESHRVSLEREPLFVVRGGDARANPTGERRVHSRAEDWQEDFAEHQDRIKRAREG